MEKILYVPSYGKETEIDIYFRKNYPETFSEKNPTIIFVSGGDGSMLHAIQDYKYMNIPFFGIAAGTLNFIMNKTTIDMLTEITNFIQSLNIIDTHTMNLTVKRKKSNGTWNSVFKTDATNDIVFGNKIMDYHTFKIKGVKKRPFEIKGMGIVFATPLGSTAFTLNNSNKILKNMNSNSIIAASIVCQKSKKFEEIVKDNNIIVRIKSERDIASLYIDGKTKVFKLNKNDKVIIKIGNSIRIAFIDKEKFYKKRENV